MTLVVARTKPNVELLSDTAVEFSASYMHERRGHTAALKAVILNSTTVVAYAGDVVRAQIAIRSWSRSMDLAATLDHLLHAHREHGINDPDFLVASCTKPATLHVIRDGAITPAADVAWIGDQQAFAAYQALFHEEHKLGPSDRMSSAFNRVVHDEDLPSVGGFQIRVYADKEGFKYAPASGVTYWPEVSSGSHEQWTPLPAGTAAEGGYSFNLLCPREAGVGAIGLYFQQGRVGYLHYPRVEEHPVVFADMDRVEFTRRANVLYGLNLWGMFSFAMTNADFEPADETNGAE